MGDCGEKAQASLAFSVAGSGTGLSCPVSALVCWRFFLLQQAMDRHVRQRSLPHHWQEKQSGQGCFLLFGLLSGT
jgi:hypothetical protein